MAIKRGRAIGEKERKENVALNDAEDEECDAGKK